MKINYHNKVFRIAGDDENVTHFNYYQQGDIVWAEYSGGTVLKGSLIAKVNGNGVLDARYQYLNKQLEFKIGKCISTPKILADGRIEIFEKYESIKTDPISKGEVTIIEVIDLI